VQPHPVLVNSLVFDSFSETAGLGETLRARRAGRTQTIFPN
jgi:hypothetical protein